MWIEKLPDGRFKYIERYVDPYTEKQKRVSTILTSESPQAIKKATKVLDEKIKKIIASSTQTDITFRKVYEEWFKQQKGALRPSSIRAYESHKKIINNFIKEDVLIRKIDTKYLQKFFNTLNYSNEYISAIKSLLNNVFKYAVKMEYIKVNPVANVEIILKAKKIEDYLSMENKYLEKEEAEKLIAELYRRPSSYRLARLAEFMYLTGMRIGEAVILTNKDFDLENKIVSVTGTIDIGNGYKAALKGPTKTLKGTRKIEITNRCIDLVKRTMEENKLDRLMSENYLEASYVFVTKSGTPIQTNSFNLALKGAGERIGLDKPLSSHIFRHSHISLLAEMNTPLKAIMDRVGHSDSDTTNKIYTHVTSDMKNNVILNLENKGL